MNVVVPASRIDGHGYFLCHGALDVMGYGSLGYLLISAGQADEGISALHQALRLSPKDPRSYLLLGMESGGHFVAGRFDQAAEVARDALNRRPGDPALRVLLAASLGNAGRDDEARSAAPGSVAI